MDVTGEITALFPAPFTAATSLELANEVNTRLRSSFETTGFSADVGGVSLVPYPSAGDDAMALVIEVRNREDSADDTSPGYDLVVGMRPDQTGKLGRDECDSANHLPPWRCGRRRSSSLHLTRIAARRGRARNASNRQ